MAQFANFFSFGSNEPRLLNFGFSRDDMGGFLPKYPGLMICS
jgi:pyruvate,orthophosphate dikinase